MKVKFRKLAPHHYEYDVYDEDKIVFSSNNWGEIASYLRAWNRGEKYDSPGV
jgi:hypothetical protein